MHLFSADAKISLKKSKLLFCPQKVEKTTTKSCILMAVGSFFLCSPNCPKQPRNSFPFYKFFYPIVSAKVSISKREKLGNFRHDLKMTSTPLCSTLSDHHHFLSQIMIAFEIKQISYQKLRPYLTNWQKNRANILVIKHRLILKSVEPRISSFNIIYLLQFLWWSSFDFELCQDYLFLWK